MHKLFSVYFLYSTMPSVTCMQLSDVSVICCVSDFQFPIQSLFLPYIGRQAAPALRRANGFDMQKIWAGTFLVQNVQFMGKTLN